MLQWIKLLILGKIFERVGPYITRYQPEHILSALYSQSTQLGHEVGQSGRVFSLPLYCHPTEFFKLSLLKSAWNFNWRKEVFLHQHGRSICLHQWTGFAYLPLKQGSLYNFYPSKINSIPHNSGKVNLVTSSHQWKEIQQPANPAR